MKKRKSNFRDNVADNAQKSNRSGGGFSYLKLPKGVSQLTLEEDMKKVKFDFLPYEVTDSKHPDRNDDKDQATVGTLWYRRPFMLHRNIGPDNKNYICRKSIGKPCPICEAQADMWEDDREGAIKLYPKDRILYIVNPLDLEKVDDAPHIWDMAVSLFHDALKDELKEDPENGIFPDLEDGKTLSIKFKWKAIGEKGKPFPEATSIEFLDRKKGYDEDILEEVPDLDAIINDSVLSYEDLKNVFFGIDKEETTDDEPKKRKKVEDDEDEDKPKRSRTKEEDEDKPKRKKEPEEDDTELTWADIDKMTESKLARICKEKKLDTDPDDYDDDLTAFKKAVAKELDIDVPKAKRKVEDDDDEPSAKGKSKKVATDECPEGYTFGKDNDKYNECDSCKVWDECIKAKEKARKK